MASLLVVDLRRLSLFLAVVDHGSFTKAAAASYLSQPGLSQAIRELEAELDTALFDRIGRRVQLTAAGQALVAHARQVLRDVDAARSAVAAVGGLQTGRIELACLPTLAADPTAALVGAFRRAHPGVVVSLADPDDSADLLSMVRTGVVELGLTEPPADRRGLGVCDLADQDLVAVLPPGTPPPLRGLTLRQITHWPLLVTPPGTSSRRVVDDALGRAGVSTHVAVETAQRDALLPLVLAGAGLALLPRAIAGMAERLGAVVAPTRPVLSRSVALVYREGELSPAARAFRDLAASTIR